ncbi:MAG: porin [Bacteroidota bacterium]
MQKKIIALAVAALASSAAFAQSNVTVYGVVDAGVARMTATGVKSQMAVESGMLGGSRIGFKGVEDLGNGLKALFTLEYALAVDDNTGVGAVDQAGTFGSGTTASNWSSSVARQQFVGLTGGFGTAVIGRLQTAGYDWACGYNPLGGSALDTVGKLGAATLLSCGSAGRANNAVAYISPSFGGVTVAVNHAKVTESRALNTTTVGAIPTGSDTNAYLGSVTYAAGPVSASAIYSKINADATTLNNTNVREWGVAGSYDFKVVKLFATYQSQKTTPAAVGADGSNKKYSIAVAAPVGAAGTVVGSYARNKLNNNTTVDDSSNAWNVSYLHALSKRTTAYAGYTHVSNQTHGDVGIVGDYNPNGVGTGDGNASVLGLGINHKF